MARSAHKKRATPHRVDAVGDDLTQARAFIDMAATCVETITGPDRLDTVRARRAVLAIANGATALSARGLTRASETALALIGNGAAQPKIDSALMTLNKLYGQYRAGLEEVEAALADTTPEIEIVPNVVAIESPTSDRDQAAATLTDLLPCVKSTRTRTALETLIAFDPASHDTIDSNLRDIPLEALIPSVTNAILAHARQMHKSVSVSYLDDETLLTAEEAKTLEPRMIELGQILVSDCLDTPARRQEQGLSQSGHISLGLTRASGRPIVTLRCTGAEMTQTALPDVTCSPLEGADMGTALTLDLSAPEDMTPPHPANEPEVDIQAAYAMPDLEPDLAVMEEDLAL